MPRLYVPGPLAAGLIDLPASTLRHVQALRLNPGDEVTVFDGSGGEWQSRLAGPPRAMRAELIWHVAVERELSPAVIVAVGMPTNERMDWLVEKATELGAAAIQPLMTARSVLRLEGERAARRVVHWQGVAIAACEQCGRNRIPQVRAVQGFQSWLAGLPGGAHGGDGPARCVLAAPKEGKAQPFAAWAVGLAATHGVLALSGPEGGLAPEEIALAARAGFAAVSLGPRVLRAETAPLALLAVLEGRMQPAPALNLATGAKGAETG